MESCLYEGVVYHERLQPVKHRFHYRLYMNFIDLDEVPTLLRVGLLSEHRFSQNAFLRCDHFGDPKQPLAESVRDLVRRETGLVASGPIRLLTQLRSFFYYFSPLNLFFCFAEGTSDVQAVVAEVQNTPWLERHCYVLWPGNRVGTEPRAEYRHPKSFHVSPFISMNVDYHWRLSAPAERLQIEIDNTQESEPFFRAAMALRRVPWSRRTQSAMHWRYPFMTARITAAIYLQALSLWRKKCPFYQHPRHRAEAMSPQMTSAPHVPERSPVSGAAE
ncbi:DUF1365 domain-containing protein [Tautonia sociabilis]|uniref:DUF1365 domain-containing protein n=1 Tax=Tautonia sociabilis TaxID=2080755 RepID=A0A432MF79_9BACT|nr:DUF1365 domain-containing protein [Tautonia sociabilis]RUL84634.1 DUF1365 domain-containing protein [Tautonia sociabilis]